MPRLPSPRGTDWRAAVRELQARAPAGGPGARVEVLARALVGRPYASNPLGGGPDEPERVVIDLERFDCATLVETVLALARSRDPAGFRRELVALRYRGGEVAWDHRLHFFSAWLRWNQRRGALRIRTRGPGAHVIETRLEGVAGLRPGRARFAVVPKRGLARARGRLSPGAVIAFASTRARLDFFHTGLLAGELPNLTLIHASRSARRVTAEPLADFLARERMRGIAFAEPLPLSPHPGARR